MPKKSNHNVEANPYCYTLQCLGGRWRMALLHEIHTFGKIRFS